MPREYNKFVQYPDLKKELILDYQNFMPQDTIRAKYKTAYETYKKVLVAEGIWDNDRHRKGTILSGKRKRKSKTENLLNRSPNSDYWIGMLLADGTISTLRNQITLGLKDLDHIQKFHSYLDSTATISKRLDPRYTSKPILYKMSAASKEVVDYFVSIGLTPAKSKTLDFSLPLNWDLMRGIFDGDGYVGCNRIDIATASESFKNQLVDFMTSEGFNPKVYNRKKYQPDTGDFFTIRIARKQEVCKFIDKLYLNAETYLERKFCKARLMQKSLGQHSLNSGNQH